MPSSFVDSVPPIMKLIIDHNPSSVLDVGPGWGKYGLMCREYLSELKTLDAVEVPPGRMAMQDHIYDQVIIADVLTRPSDWKYDLIMIIDVIEHMDKVEGQALVGEMLSAGASVLISTPKVFIEQHDEHNPYETHVSLWDWTDLWFAAAPNVNIIDGSTIDSMISLITPELEN